MTITWKASLGSLLFVVVSVACSQAGAKEEPAAGATESAMNGAPASVSNTATTQTANVNALLGVLVTKGVLAPREAAAIREAAPGAEFEMLVQVLARKGIVSSEELSGVSGSIAPTVQSPPAVQAPSAPAKAAPPKVIPAVAPLRVLQLEPSKAEGMVPDLKLGSGARLKVYGMVKTSVIYDTSAPYGTDMPLPGFITASGTAFDPGPTRSPEFHAKARFARVGSSFEWPDVAGSNNVITGKLEFDFEGNFSRALNRNISRFGRAWLRSDWPMDALTTGSTRAPACSHSSGRTGRPSDRPRCQTCLRRPGSGWALEPSTSAHPNSVSASDISSAG